MLGCHTTVRDVALSTRPSVSAMVPVAGSTCAMVPVASTPTSLLAGVALGVGAGLGGVDDVVPLPVT